jgi:hypothetical protein
VAEDRQGAAAAPGTSRRAILLRMKIQLPARISASSYGMKT